MLPDGFEKEMIDLKVKALISPVVASLGLELYAVECVSLNQRLVLRVYVEKDGGVTLGDCEKLTKVINSMLRVEPSLEANNYNLEVSSPGLDRKLFTPSHYHAQIGKRIRVTLQDPLNARKNFTGILKSVTADKIEILDNENIMHDIALQSVSTANVVFQ